MVDHERKLATVTHFLVDSHDPVRICLVLIWLYHLAPQAATLQTGSQSGLGNVSALRGVQLARSSAENLHCQYLWLPNNYSTLPFTLWSAVDHPVTYYTRQGPDLLPDHS